MSVSAISWALSIFDFLWAKLWLSGLFVLLSSYRHHVCSSLIGPFIRLAARSLGRICVPIYFAVFIAEVFDVGRCRIWIRFLRHERFLSLMWSHGGAWRSRHPSRCRWLL